MSKFTLISFLLLSVFSSCFSIESGPVNQLTFKFYQSLESDLKTKQNIVYSPLSIALSLGMLMQAAPDSTCEEVSKFLGQAEDEISPPVLHENFKDIMDEYSTDEKEFRLNIWNEALISQRSKVKQSFKRKLADYYKASAESVNFEDNSLAMELNKKISEKSGGLIKQSIGEIEASSEMVLLNTIAFKGKWTKAFDKSFNHEAYFYNSDHSRSRITYMAGSRSVRYANFNDKSVSVLEMPYNGNASIFYFLPNQQNGLNQLMANLNEEEIENFISGLAMHTVSVHLPKMKIETNYDLLPVFSKTSLKTVIESNYPNIADSNQPLRLSDMKHKSAIHLDEDGTKAAALTSLTLMPLSLHMNGQVKSLTFVADHPFFFLIRDNSVGLNLFAGTVNKF